MKTTLAYVIVIALSQFCLTAGGLTSAILALLLFWLPAKVRAPFCALVGGASGSVLSVSLAWVVFTWLLGPDSFGLFPFLAATLPLSIPVYNDYKKAKEMKDIREKMTETVAAHVAPDVSAFNCLVWGELVGIAIAGIVFL